MITMPKSFQTKNSKNKSIIEQVVLITCSKQADYTPQGATGFVSRRMLEIFIIGFELVSGNLCGNLMNSFQEAELGAFRKWG